MKKYTKISLLIFLVLYLGVGVIIASDVAAFSDLQGCLDNLPPSINGAITNLEPRTPTCQQVESREYYSKFFLALVAWPYVVVALR